VPGGTREHLVAPDRHADYQQQQSYRSERDRHVNQRQVTSDRSDDQQADSRNHNGHDHAEPDHRRAPPTAPLQAPLTMTRVRSRHPECLAQMRVRRPG
jgi:hypothetical protein